MALKTNSKPRLKKKATPSRSHRCLSMLLAMSRDGNKEMAQAIASRWRRESLASADPGHPKT
jgi:hypothetical protein